LTITLGTLWQPLYTGRAPGAHQAEEEAVEEVEEAVEEAVEEEAEDNQLLSLRSNLSPSRPPLTYASWERSPTSSKEKETKPTAL